MSRVSPGRVIAWVVTIAVITYLVAPIVVVFPLAFSSGRYLEFPPPGLSTRWFENFLSSERWTSAAATSITVAIGASSDSGMM